MLMAKCSASSTNGIIPFDTVAVNTNGNLALSNNTIQEKAAGVYRCECMAVLTNSGSSDVTATLSQYADGTAISGASVSVTVPAGCAVEAYLPYAITVKSASSGTAFTSWYVSGGTVAVSGAVAVVSKYF